MKDLPSRRHLLSSSLAAGLALAATARGATKKDAAEKEKEEPEVTATEDLMREHGILRRILLVYRGAAETLRRDAPAVDGAALGEAARLFRTFGEEYHEKMLEEAHIFPVVRKRGGRAATYPDVLVEQHRRGREITDYVLAVTKRGRLAAPAGTELAGVFDELDRMYENHAAREDTIVFPAWKSAFTNAQLDEIGDQFEDIEKKMFGHDGFEDAEKRISSIETALGFEDLAKFTAPPPPKGAWP
ncbi:MAG TPA: hemerythrin domain-containing protein [Thermoanaerobaculia bacterium]|nr:hemerythrin domain-containing protein [Thermoanaerobaculia bacterium]